CPTGHCAVSVANPHEVTQMPVSGGVSVEPLPLKLTCWGAPAASSDIESVPVMSPETPGVKVTPIVQLAPGARLGIQLLFSAKLAVAATVPTLSATVP